MYYIINLTDEQNTNCIEGERIYKGEIYMFPVLCRVDDIISGHLNLDSDCCQNLSKQYKDLFEVVKDENLTNVIKQCASSIIEAHPIKPVVGVFNNGKYDKRLTLETETLMNEKIEALFEECKV